MLDNLNILLELNETKWLKQTLEKALSAIRQIPQATPTKVSCNNNNDMFVYCYHI